MTISRPFLKAIFIVAIIGLLLMGVVAFTAIGETKSEGLCVDGDGDVNLEGIMCLKEKYTFFGYTEGSSEYIFLQFVLFLSIFLFGGMAVISFAGLLFNEQKGGEK